VASWYFAANRMWNLKHPNEQRPTMVGAWRRAATLAVQRR